MTAWVRPCARLLRVFPVGPGPHRGGLGGQVEHVAQWSAVAAGLVQASRAATGVVRDRNEPGGGPDAVSDLDRTQREVLEHLPILGHRPRSRSAFVA